MFVHLSVIVLSVRFLYLSQEQWQISLSHEPTATNRASLSSMTAQYNYLVVSTKHPYFYYHALVIMTQKPLNI